MTDVTTLSWGTEQGLVLLSDRSPAWELDPANVVVPVNPAVTSIGDPAAVDVTQFSRGRFDLGPGDWSVRLHCSVRNGAAVARFVRLGLFSPQGAALLGVVLVPTGGDVVDSVRTVVPPKGWAHLAGAATLTSAGTFPLEIRAAAQDSGFQLRGCHVELTRV